MTLLALLRGLAFRLVYGSTPVHVARRKPTRTEDREPPPRLLRASSRNPMSRTYAPAWACPKEKAPERDGRAPGAAYDQLNEEKST